MIVFIFRGFVVFRLFGFVSASFLQFHLSQLADYYGVLDTDITLIQY